MASEDRNGPWDRRQLLDRLTEGFNLAGVQRAPKRALKVLRRAGDCKRLWAIVRLIQRPHDDSLLGSAALREVSAAERFRRVLDGSVVLFDSDSRLQVMAG